MFKAMFNTGFVRSNYLTLSRDEVDVQWDSKDQFPKDFKAEVCYRFSFSYLILFASWLKCLLIFIRYSFWTLMLL